ncbi:hypothetical protein BJ322DRAFT_371116 [Thelephora terrestris]|uniref:Uncharacterized protein n=1 Tax=Thelephora terrestris TaxID=56493 RepID=A0A9P6L2R0_9AGAM|nr:hypothetical protein BJ322DRAFT_371116 [Thelephora terrestris]
MENLRQFNRIRDASGVWMVWTCCIICLSHLAALCHFMDQTVPAWNTFMRNLYDLTLGKLCDLSLEVPIEVYSYFDVLTGVRISHRFVPLNEVRRLPSHSIYAQMSWKTTLDSIDARLGLQLDTESESLRHRKTIVEDAYLNFQESFPGFECNSFACLVIATDGRSESTDFPNLAVPEERMVYGL